MCGYGLTAAVVVSVKDIVIWLKLLTQSQQWNKAQTVYMIFLIFLFVIVVLYV